MPIDIPTSYKLLSAQTREDKLKQTQVKLVTIAELPSIFGEFILLGFKGFEDGKEHTAIVKGDIVGKENVLTRVHSECLTGEVLGSLRCDCREQLEMSLRFIEENEQGLLIYLRQEGRGIGLLNKIRAYELQDKGLNTLEANRALGFDDDMRVFDNVVTILDLLDIKSINLMTNNPRKIIELQELGVKISGRRELIAEINEYNEFYLKTKKEHFNHLLDRGANFDELLEINSE